MYFLQEKLLAHVGSKCRIHQTAQVTERALVTDFFNLGVAVNLCHVTWCFFLG